jgi:hypothetical protein
MFTLICGSDKIFWSFYGIYFRFQCPASSSLQQLYRYAFYNFRQFLVSIFCTQETGLEPYAQLRSSQTFTRSLSFQSANATPATPFNAPRRTVLHTSSVEQAWQMSGRKFPEPRYKVIFSLIIPEIATYTKQLYFMFNLRIQLCPQLLTHSSCIVAIILSSCIQNWNVATNLSKTL